MSAHDVAVAVVCGWFSLYLLDRSSRVPGWLGTVECFFAVVLACNCARYLVAIATARGWLS